MTKRKGGTGPCGDDDDGILVAERARIQRELFNPQTQSEDIDTAAAIFDPHWDPNRNYDFGADDSSQTGDTVLPSTHDVDWNLAIDSDWPNTLPDSAACQSGCADQELPAQKSSTALVCFGLVCHM
jgi:hypothetical protein